MDKKLKKRAIDFFSKCMHESLPSFILYKQKSEYFFGSEKVWEDTTTFNVANLYIIFSPEYKGRDQFTIEIGWSKLHRFPEVPRRPYLSFKADFEKCYTYPEATARLPKIITLDTSSWIDINNDNVEQVVSHQFENLVKYGIPFLKGIGAPSVGG